VETKVFCRRESSGFGVYQYPKGVPLVGSGDGDVGYGTLRASQCLWCSR
jgi:hypothetical protein